LYSSASDALERLLGGEECVGGRCIVTNITSGGVYIANGLRYFAIEVTSRGGVQYGISAFDREAEDLQRVASRLLSTKNYEVRSKDAIPAVAI